jgi:hypothetical protein
MEPSRRQFLSGIVAAATIAVLPAATAEARAPKAPPPPKLLKGHIGFDFETITLDPATGRDITVISVYNPDLAPGDRVQVWYLKGSTKELTDKVYKVLSVDHGRGRPAMAEVEEIYPSRFDLPRLPFDRDVHVVGEGDLPLAQVTLPRDRGETYRAHYSYVTTSASGPAKQAGPTRPQYTWPSPKRSRRR